MKGLRLFLEKKMAELLLFIKEKYEGKRPFLGLKISNFPCCGPITFGPSLKEFFRISSKMQFFSFAFLLYYLKWSDGSGFLVRRMAFFSFLVIKNHIQTDQAITPQFWELKPLSRVPILLLTRNHSQFSSQ